MVPARHTEKRAYRQNNERSSTNKFVRQTYPILYISENNFTKLSAKIIASIYFFLESIHCHHKIQVPIGLVAEVI